MQHRPIDTRLKDQGPLENTGHRTGRDQRPTIFPRSHGALPHNHRGATPVPSVLQEET
jgi:hypothetical protein